MNPDIGLKLYYTINLSIYKHSQKDISKD